MSVCLAVRLSVWPSVTAPAAQHTTHCYTCPASRCAMPVFLLLRLCCCCLGLECVKLVAHHDLVIIPVEDGDSSRQQTAGSSRGQQTAAEDSRQQAAAEESRHQAAGRNRGQQAAAEVSRQPSAADIRLQVSLARPSRCFATPPACNSINTACCPLHWRGSTAGSPWCCPACCGGQPTALSRCCWQPLPCCAVLCWI